MKKKLKEKIMQKMMKFYCRMADYFSNFIVLMIQKKHIEKNLIIAINSYFLEYMVILNLSLHAYSASFIYNLITWSILRFSESNLFNNSTILILWLLMEVLLHVSWRN